MSPNKRAATVFVVFAISIALILIVVLTAAQAADDLQAKNKPLADVEISESLQLSPSLSVTIMSSPWALLDSNKPDEDGPSVFVVEARVENPGPDPATNVMVSLDYDDAAGWKLIDGEDPLRRVDSLAAGPDEAFFAYWLAEYPRQIGASHQYTVTAEADGIAAVSTSINYFGSNLLPQDKTVQTKSYVSAGNSGITSVFTNVVVGVIYTATIDYDLGSGPQGLQFSPVGNTDFDASSSQLLGTSVRFYNDTGTDEVVVPDQVYFSSVPQVAGQTAENAEVSYYFLPRRLATVKMCSYAGVEYISQSKYDNEYCDDPAGTIIIIDYELSFSMTKKVSSPTVLQGESLTYTIHYTNEASSDLALAWIWDQVDSSLVTVLTDTIDPAHDLTTSTGSLVVWDIGHVPAQPDPSSTGTLTFSVSVDGKGADITDGAQVTNQAFMGFNNGSPPAEPALTSTVSTVVQAPDLVISKSDGTDFASPGAALTYTINITNQGSAVADSLVLTDVLPADVSYQGGATEGSTDNGQTLVWGDLGPLAANGGALTITIPVTVNFDAVDGAVLTNTVWAEYTNAAGYVYDQQSAVDTTDIQAPTLSIYKTASPDPVFRGTELVYTLTYSNSGQSEATNVVITDVVPLSTTFVSCSGGDQCYPDSGTVTWELSSVPAALSGAVSFTVLVDSDLEEGSVLVNDSYGVTADQGGFTAGDMVTTTVTRNAGFVDGVTFEDSNGNGSLDPGEGGIPDVDVSLAAATDPNQTTAGSGYYHFTVEEEKWVAVSAGLPADYFRTTPGTVLVSNQFQVTQTVDFGYAPITSTFGVVFGTVFEDLNGDGTQDLGERGLSGVKVVLVGGQETFTDDYGRYALKYTSDGTFRIVETDPTGYFSTTPNEVAVSVVTGSSQEVNFGDAPESSIFGSIHGTVFDDQNGDGIWDGDEPGLAGVLVTLDEGVSKSTDINGSYFFKISNPGIHKVSETDPAGYRSTTANQVNLQVLDGQGFAVNFGDTQFEGTDNIFGIVFDDADGSGTLESGELGLAGVQVTLNGSLVANTDQFGRYSFYVSNAGVHKVVESDPAGYFSTTPNEVHTALALAETVQVDFGDAQDSSNFASLVGTVFEDLDSDGEWDDSEVGISNVDIDLGDSTTNTGKFGGYSFKIEAPGSYEVVETDPVGYFSTTPNEVDFEVEIGNGYLVDFGDVPVEIARCTGDDYEPDDTMDTANELNSGTVQSHNFCDNAVDWVKFDTTKGFTYTLAASSWGQRADTVITLFDMIGKQVAGNDDAEGSDDYSSTLVWKASSSGVFFLRVTNRAGLTGFYTGYDLSLETEEYFKIFMPHVRADDDAGGSSPASLSSIAAPSVPIQLAGVIEHSCPDDYEIDDTWQLASPVEIGVSQVRSFDSNPFLFAADKDFLSFDLMPKGSYTFTIESRENTETLMEMYDSSGNNLGISDENQIVWADYPPGRYYLSISPGPVAENHGCSDEVGYTFIAQSTPVYTLFLAHLRSD